MLLSAYLSLVSCQALPDTQSRTVYQNEGQKACTEKRPARYTSDFESRLKAVLPLVGKTGAEAEGLIKSFLSQQFGGTRFGEDLQGYLFYICQMSNSGKWSADETLRAIALFKDKSSSWNQERSQRNLRCLNQLERGYVLKDEIDKEYFRTKEAGTFQEQQDALVNKWIGNAIKWEEDTKVVLIQIGDPVAKGRFGNGPISPYVLNNTNPKWNRVRNVLQASLNSLDEICRDVH